MRRSSLLTLLIIIGVICIVAAYTFYVVSSNQEVERNQARKDLVGDETLAPYTNLSGDELSLESYLGEILVVNAWASWSPHSRDELPLLNRIAGEYEGMTVLAINRSESKEQTERFMRSLPELQNLEFILDSDDRFFKAVNGYAMPETIIYNTRGEVVLHRRGTISEQEFRVVLDRLTSE